MSETDDVDDGEAWDGATDDRSSPTVIANPALRFEAKRALVGGSPEYYAATANGGPALVVVVDGRVIGVMCVEVAEDGLAAFRSQVNPDKLERATRVWQAADHGEPLVREAF